MSEKNFVIETGLTIAGGGNVDGVTNLTATGNIDALYFVGNGSQLTGISGSANIGNLEIVGATIFIEPGAPDTEINISPSGESWAFLQLPTNDTANTYNTRLWNAAGGHFMYFSGTTTLYAGNANNPPYGPGGFGSTTTFNTGTWYCATVVFSSPQIWIYVNGVQDAYDPTYGPAHSGDGSVNLACFGPGGNLLNGNIAEVYCYAQALSAQEVLQNFNATRSRYGL